MQEHAIRHSWTIRAEQVLFRVQAALHRFTRPQAKGAEGIDRPIILSARDSRSVLDALESPPQPNPALEKAVRSYAEGVHSGRIDSQ